MPDNDFWIGQEQIPVDLSLLLTYSNDEDYWHAPGEYALRVYTVDTLNTNFARPCFALGERTSDPEREIPPPPFRPVRCAVFWISLLSARTPSIFAIWTSRHLRRLFPCCSTAAKTSP